MIIISHRANLRGSDYRLENSPVQVGYVLENHEFDIEIDVWKVRNKWYLGHDEPKYSIDVDVLKNPRLWNHAKNLEALDYMTQHDIHCFWHQNDHYTITSHGILWANRNQEITENCIIVSNKSVKGAMGVCTDYPCKL